MDKASKLLHLLEDDDNEFDDDDSDQPQSDDIFLTPSGSLGSKVSVSADGKFVGEYSGEDAAEVAIVNWINKNKFYPNIWWQDDHGGHSRYTLEPKNQKKIKI
jgi:hypothetical protein